MIIGIDFDGTVVKHAYPAIGEDIGAIPVLKEIIEAGHQLVLFTMRHQENGTLWEAMKWFMDNGIPLYGINHNPTQWTWTTSPKAYCNLYIDDAGLGCPTKIDNETGRPYVDWEKVSELLRERGILPPSKE